MEHEEYLKLRKELDEEHKAKTKKLVDAYGMANNPYPVGSVFEDHTGKILVEKVQVYDMKGRAMVVHIYIGTVIRKDGKKGTTRTAWSSNDVTTKNKK